MARRHKRRMASRRKGLTRLTQFVLGLVLSLVFVFALSGQAKDRQAESQISNQVEVLKDYNFVRDIVPAAQGVQASTGMLSSLILAQAALESDFGQSTLASKYNNLFGMKAYDESQASINLETKEYTDGQWVTLTGTFRVYKSWQESIESHTRLFQEGVDWDPDKYKNLFTSSNYKEAARNIQADGYATDPTYSDKLIKMIEAYHLNNYDKK